MASIERRVVFALKGLQDIAGAIPIPTLRQALSAAFEIARLLDGVERRVKESHALEGRSSDDKMNIDEEPKTSRAAGNALLESLEELRAALWITRCAVEKKRPAFNSLHHLEGSAGRIEVLATRVEKIVRAFRNAAVKSPLKNTDGPVQVTHVSLPWADLGKMGGMASSVPPGRVGNRVGRGYDETAIAQGLYWLRVAKERPRRVVIWEPELECGRTEK